MKNLEIKKNIINRIIKNGEKKTSEKILLKCFKELQKESLKQTKNLIKLALISSMSIFKLVQVSNKKIKKKKGRANVIKVIPDIIRTNNSRVSLAIKLIKTTIQNKKNKHFFNKFYSEILLNSQNKGDTINRKDELQIQALILYQKKRYLKKYKWR